MVFREGKKWLFNPLLKKRYEDRPEERVRLRWTDYLLLEAGWKGTRIAFEAPVRLQKKSSALRADLILYDQNLAPDTLIECKSEQEQLNQQVAEQAGLYNSSVGASTLILTNGLEDLCYIREENRFTVAPLPFSVGETDWRSRSGYWSGRGFCEEQYDIEKGWLPELLNRFWDVAERPYYLKPALDPNIPSSHYYRIFSLDEEEKLAITFTGTSGSGSWLLALLNRKDKPGKALAVSLNALVESSPDNAVIYHDRGEDQLDLHSSLQLPTGGNEETLNGFVRNLPHLLRSFF